MTTKQLLVKDSGRTVIECPQCACKKPVNVEPFKGKKHVMRVKCSCSHIFMIRLNFRKHFRKDTSLDARYYHKHLSPSGTKGTTRNVINCTIKNLSVGGLGLEIIGKHLIDQGNKLMVTFHLDNAKKTLIQRPISVKTVRGNLIGSEFLDKDGHSTELGFYLMP